MLAPPHLHLLPAQHRQRAGDARPRRLRHDHVVDIAALYSDEGRQERIHKLVRGEFRRAGILQC
jgi:hypothetical protein